MKYWRMTESAHIGHFDQIYSGLREFKRGVQLIRARIIDESLGQCNATRFSDMFMTVHAVHG